MKPFSSFKKNLAAILAAGAMTANADLIPFETPTDSDFGNFTYTLRDPAIIGSGFRTFNVIARNPYGADDLETYDYHFMNQLIDDLWTLPANQSEYATKQDMVSDAMGFTPFGDSLAGEDVVDFGWNFIQDTATGSINASNNGFIRDVTYQAWDDDPNKAIGNYFMAEKLIDGNRNGIFGEVGDMQFVYDTNKSVLATVDGGVFGTNLYGNAPRAEVIVPEGNTLGLMGLGALAAYAVLRGRKKD
jgi:hypothetical protein